jgi:hypothetical protein
MMIPTSSRFPRAIAIAITAAFLTAAPLGIARADSAAADALFNEAKALAEAKKFNEACPKFEASYKLDKAVGTLMNLADCHENIGRIASAWGEWGEAFDWLTREGDKRSKFVSQRRDALTPRLPKLTINVTTTSPRLKIYRGSTPLDEGAYNSALPIDPGAHSITVRRGEEILKEEKITIEEKGSQALSFDLDAIEKAAPPPKPTGPAAIIIAPPPVKSTQRTVGFLVGGAGILSVLVAAALEVGALTGSSAIEEPDACVGKYCSPKGLATVSRVGTFADVGQWVGIGGILLTGVGLTLVITAPSPSPAQPSSDGLPSTRAGRKEPKTQAFIAPYVGPQGGGITFAGTL